jgi:hypothetical protein
MSTYNPRREKIAGIIYSNFPAYTSDQFGRRYPHTFGDARAYSRSSSSCQNAVERAYSVADEVIAVADEAATPSIQGVREAWQPVTGWEGRYEVSRDGEIRKLNGEPIGQWLNQDGYALVRLSSPRKMVRVHRAVADAFVPNPRGLPHVNHIDNDRSNNSADNLEWCDQATNIAHMDAQGRRSKHWLGKRSPAASLSDDEVRELRALYAAGGISLEKVAKRFSISKRAAGRCVNRETYSDVL